MHRTEPKKLILSDDDRIYDSHEIKDILNMVDTGNRSKGQGQKTTGGLTRVKSAFGIAGFVRFHSGYYIVRIIFQPSLYLLFLVKPEVPLRTLARPTIYKLNSPKVFCFHLF